MGRIGEGLGQMRNADISIDGIIQLKWILNKWDMRVWI
jgi:hypothetical protein